MFHSAALKLTLWYLIIIMALSIAFSVAIYHLSSDELFRNNQRQTYFLNDRLPQRNFNSFTYLRQQDLDDAMRHLRGNLLLFNLMVLIGGGAASYALARRTLQPIEDSLESQKRFTGDASHELRTPLAVMQTENEVALRNPKLTKQEAVDQLKSNLEEVAKLKMLSDGLLKLSSFDSTTPLETVVDMKDVAAEAAARWEKAAAAKKIKLTSNLSSGKVRGDSDSLIELLSVLIDNAIKYNQKGGEVIISTGRRGRNIVCTVADKGKGIAAADLPKVFERFYQAESSRSGSDGYGLGLSIAKRIAEVHNGVIEVRSAPNKGSTFTVVIPQA